MKKYFILLSLMLVVATSVKVMLFGGASDDNQTDIYQALANATNKKPFNCGNDIKATKCPIVAVATSAAQTQKDGMDAYNTDETGSLGYKNLFIKYGFFPVPIYVHIDTYKIGSNLSTSTGKQNAQYLQVADVLFFNGGDQSRHSRSWLNDDGSYNDLMKIAVERANKNLLILAGTSAGTLIMPKYTFGQGSSLGMWYFHNSKGLAPKNVADGGVNGTNLRDQRNGTNCFQERENGGKMPGFNMVGFQSDAHTNARGRVSRLVAKLFQFRTSLGVAVDQNTAFLSIDQQMGYVYGLNGVTIVDISKAKITQSSYFQVSNVTLSYLTAQDSYNFKTNQVITSKPLITTPKYNSFTDSSNIMASDQISLLLTRVVDQKPSYNVGKAKIPSNYPNDTPKFQMIFSRNNISKGYYDGSKQNEQMKKKKSLKLIRYQASDINEEEQFKAGPVNSRYAVSNVTLQMTYI